MIRERQKSERERERVLICYYINYLQKFDMEREQGTEALYRPGGEDLVRGLNMGLLLSTIPGENINHVDVRDNKKAVYICSVLLPFS